MSRQLRRLLPASTITILTLAALAGPQAAHAQAVDYGALEQLFGEPVTTSATGSPQKASDAPVNMEIITADQIRQSGADNIPDILQFVAGLQVRRYSHGQADVSIRGYDQPFSPRLLVLVNGRQVYLDAYGYTAWQSIPVQLDEIRQIEVVKGPASALFGFNAVGGVINIITYDPLTDSKNVVTVRGGTKLDGSVSAVGTAHWKDKAGIRLSVGGDRADEFSPGNNPRGGNSYFTHPYANNLSADGRYKLTDKIELTAEGTTTDSRDSEQEPTLAESVLAMRTNSGKFGIAADTRLGLLDIGAYRDALNETIGSNTGNLELQNTVYVAHVSDLFKIGADHTVRVGLEYRNNSGTSSIYGGTMGFETYSADGMWNWQINPKFALTNSVRVDYMTLNYTGSLVAHSPYTVAQYNNATVVAPSFNSGLVYKPTDIDTIKVSVARGIQAPSIVDLGINLNAGPVNLVGNPLLDPSAVMNYEVDYDRAITRLNSVLRMAIYYQETTDLLASPLNTPLGFPGGNPTFASANVGSSDAVGGEIGLKGSNARGLRWNASYSLSVITDHLSFGKPVGAEGLLDYQHGTPTSSIVGGLGYTWHKFELDGQARWQSRYIDYGFNTAGTAILPTKISDYLTLDGRAAYNFNDHLTFALSAAQLNSTRIITTAGLPTERRFLFSLTAHL